MWLKRYFFDWNITFLTETLLFWLKRYFFDWNVTFLTETLLFWLKRYFFDWNVTFWLKSTFFSKMQLWLLSATSCSWAPSSKSVLQICINQKLSFRNKEFEKKNNVTALDREINKRQVTRFIKRRVLCDETSAASKKSGWPAESWRAFFWWSRRCLQTAARRIRPARGSEPDSGRPASMTWVRRKDRWRLKARLELQATKSQLVI